MGVRDRTAPSVGGAGYAGPFFLWCIALFSSANVCTGEEFQSRSEFAFEIWVALIICVLFFFSLC